jgi:hypothetical protein
MRRTISGFEATRAIYIDFEGVMDAPPVLLGAYWIDDAKKEHFVQYVFEKTLESAARAKAVERGGTCVYLDSLENALEALCFVAESEDRLLIEWSTREEQAVAEAQVNPTITAIFKSRIRNALPEAKRWKNRNYPAVVFPLNHRSQRNSLNNFMDFTGMPTPNFLRPVAARIRYVMTQIERRGTYASLTSVAKAKWTNMLSHNQWDCRGTRHVLLQACETGGTRIPTALTTT